MTGRLFNGFLLIGLLFNGLNLIDGIEESITTGLSTTSIPTAEDGEREENTGSKRIFV